MSSRQRTESAPAKIRSTKRNSTLSSALAGPRLKSSATGLSEPPKDPAAWSSLPAAAAAPPPGTPPPAAGAPPPSQTLWTRSATLEFGRGPGNGRKDVFEVAVPRTPRRSSGEGQQAVVASAAPPTSAAADASDRPALRRANTTTSNAAPAPAAFNRQALLRSATIGSMAAGPGSAVQRAKSSGALSARGSRDAATDRFDNRGTLSGESLPSGRVGQIRQQSLEPRRAGAAQDATAVPPGWSDQLGQTLPRSPNADRLSGKADKENRIGNSAFNDTAGVDKTKWRKWQKLVDNKALGGHYDFISPELPASHEVPDATQKDLDSLYADVLTKRRPEEAPHPRLGERLPAATSAFTDRALRLREGRGTRNALLHNDPVPTEYGAEHGTRCSCPVCRPCTQHAAGQPSHQVHYNKTNRANKDFPPPPVFWDESALSNHALHSARMNATIKYEPPTNETESEFRKFLGCKVKASASSPDLHGRPEHTHRTGPLDAKRVSAGTFDHERSSILPDRRHLGRQAWQAGTSDEAPRSGMSLILQPLPNDPPPPSRISCTSKAQGVYKEGFSADSERIAIHQNQEMMRFADPRTPRGRSQPAYRSSDFAGRPTGCPQQHMHEVTDLLTGRGVRFSETLPLGKPATARDHRSHRNGAGNQSNGMSFLMNHDRMQDSFESEKDWRMKTERSFAELCERTEEVVLTQRGCAEPFKGINGNKTSDLMRSHLVWEH